MDRLLPSFVKLFFNEKADGIMKTFKIRESNLTTKINNYTKSAGLLIILVLIIILSLLYRNISSIESISNNFESFPNNVQSISFHKLLGNETYTALFSVFILICFQYWFYLYGLQYSYPGSNGIEEFQKLIFENIKV